MASDTPTVPDIPTFRFNADINLSGFSGTREFIDKAILELSEEIITLCFALRVEENGRYDNINDQDILVLSLVIAGGRIGQAGNKSAFQGSTDHSER